MRDCSAEPKPAARTITLILFVLAALIGRGVFAWFPFDSDASMYIYMGRLASEGERVGRDLIDIKFSTVGLLLSLPWRAIGAHWAAWVLLGVTLSGLSSLALSRAAARHFGAHAARPTLLASLALLNLNYLVFGGFQLETVYAFFVVLAGCVALEVFASRDSRDAFVVGLCAGVAMYAKPTAVGVMVAFAFAMCLARRDARLPIVKLLAAALLGICVPLGCFAVYVYSTGSLGEVLTTADQIARYGRNSAFLPTDIFKPLLVIALAGFPLLIRGWVLRRDTIESKQSSSTWPLWVFVIAWLLIEFAGAVAQRRMYSYHFFPMAAPLALLFGAMPRRDRTLPTVAALTPLLMLSLFGVWTRLPMLDRPDARAEVVSFLQREASPNDRIWQDDCARLLIQTDLKPGSRFPLTFLFSVDDEAPSTFGRELVNDLRERRPTFVVLDRDVTAAAASRAFRAAEFNVFEKRGRDYKAAWASIDTFTREHYRPVEELGDQVVWKWTGNARADRSSASSEQANTLAE